MNKYACLSYIDNLILDDIRHSGTLRDMELARHLRCPRIFLMDRLERLMLDGYIQAGPERRYALTEKGTEAWIPLDPSPEPAEADAGQEEFDWSGLYIPRAGWMDDRQDRRRS